MAVNLRLTHAVKDRAVQDFRLNGSELLIRFFDGSMMTVTIAECNSLPFHEGARIRQVSEDQTMLLFECEDESILDVTIVDPGNCDCSRQERSGRISRVSWEWLLSAFSFGYRRIYDKFRGVKSGSPTADVTCFERRSKGLLRPSRESSEFSDLPRNARFLSVCDDPRLHRLTVNVSNSVAGWSERRGWAAAERRSFERDVAFSIQASIINKP